MSRNFGELVTAVVYKDFEAKTNIETEVKAWINDGYMRMASRDLRCFRTKATLAITSASQTYAIASAFPNYRLMIEQWTTSGPIDFIPEENAMSIIHYGTDFSGWDIGHPTTSWVESSLLYIYPRINENYNVFSFYYQVPDLLVNDADAHLIPQNKEELLINYAKILYDFREKDWSAVDRQVVLFERELDKWEIEDARVSKRSTSILKLQREYNSKLLGRRARIYP